MKKILQFKLKLLAKLYLWRYKPIVVGITGSVGKTSAKDAIGLALLDQMRVRISAKSYNNQIGLPLTILGFNTPGKNIFGWLALLLKAFGRIFYDANWPQVLVLEMGADRMGDLKYLTSIVKPNISVITNVAPAHLQAFKDLASVAKEKSVLVSSLKTNDWAIMNNDDQLVRAMANQTKAKKIFYSLKSGTDIWASDLKFSEKNLIFNLHSDNQVYPLQLKSSGEHLVYPILMAFSVAQILKLDPKTTVANLTRFQALNGRGRFLEGKNNNLIIDETYNASPLSMAAALKFLKQIETVKNKVAILGDMRELGEQSLPLHQALVSQLDFVDQIILVGPEIKPVFEILKNKPNVFYFSDVEVLNKNLEQLIKANNLILVKGSQAIRLEKTVEKLITSSYNKKEVLVRQSEEWQGK
jgi:UDP-N-acetylmuramoyl-tripeptide--D-alanyl-D-alanine ligase